MLLPTLFSTLPAHALLGRLLALRAIMILAWVLGIAWLHLGMHISLPLLPMGAVLALLALFAAATGLRLRHDFPATQMEFLAHLLTDLTAFAVLVFFSGGVTNPFVSLMLVPIVIAAISLKPASVWTLAAVASVFYVVLLFNHIPLAVADPVAAYGMHLGGMWLNFVISAAIIAFFITRMSTSMHERELQLAELREKRLRDERILALGAQAASAAHELATPLATIAMTAGEMARDYANDPEIGADCQRLKEQAAVCKVILNRLAERARENDAPTPSISARKWISDVVERWQILRPQISVTLKQAENLAELEIAPPEELEQALMNLFNNAADASPAQVEIRAACEADQLRIAIADRGPGFSAAQKALAGRVLFTGKPGQGMGLGLTLTHATVERLGGEVVLTERAGGGASVSVGLPLARLQP
jgi:two-component system, sensor histidine kinase RegB